MGKHIETERVYKLILLRKGDNSPEQLIFPNLDEAYQHVHDLQINPECLFWAQIQEVRTTKEIVWQLLES